LSLKPELHHLESEESSRRLRRAVTRRKAIQFLLAGAAGGLTAGPLVSSTHPVHRHLKTESTLDAADAEAAAADWTPKFLSGHQSDSLQAFAERMIPGSSTAQVHRFIDLLLSVDTERNRKRFLSALSAFEAAALERHQQPFVRLTAEQQDAILSHASRLEPALAGGSGLARRYQGPASGAGRSESASLRDHFDHLKGWVSSAYYTSEIGMRELGWTGVSFFDEFPGCTHPGGHS
jgi:hypothetical protein